MHRRKFMRLSGGSLLAVMAGCSAAEWATLQDVQFNLTLHSDMAVGHKVFEMKDRTPSATYSCDTLIVGAGMAGLSAAWHLRDRNVVVCELSDRIGGSAASEQYQNAVFPQGAHYDLDYPHYFGEESLKFLENLGVVSFDNTTNLWRFTERQYVINYYSETQALYKGEYWDDVIPSEGEEYERFMQLTERYIGKLKLPTRLIDAEWHALDQETFYAFLQREMPLSARFARGVDYQVVDDFGANSQQISALAGLFYYAGRPYRGEQIETFSPPEGNAYFARKIAAQLPQEAIKLRHLVRKIIPNKQGATVEVLDLSQNQVIAYKAKSVVYAGQKHALKFVYSQDYPLFEQNVYAPWMVVSFVLSQNNLPAGFWQNEMLSMERNFLGFIDSDAQLADRNHRVLTAYYCLPEWNRSQLAKVDENAPLIAAQTLENIAQYFEVSSGTLRESVEKVFLKVMGHAMPIPVPNYLFKDKNTQRSHPHIVYAGTDNSRLPLLLEAIDSGIVAAQLLKEKA